MILSLQQMAEKIKKEFPGNDVFFTMEIRSFKSGRMKIEIQIDNPEIDKPIECENLQDGINQLHRALNPRRPNQTILEVA